MEDYLSDAWKSFKNYFTQTDFGNFEFWLFCLAAIFSMWLLSVLLIKFAPKELTGGRSKQVLRIHKFLILSANILAAILIGIIAYFSSTNYFSHHSHQLIFLIVLLFFFGMASVFLYKLMKLQSAVNAKEIINIPYTKYGEEVNFKHTKKIYSKIKFYWFIPIAGFLLYFILPKEGNNHISIVFDNSGSMAENVQDANISFLERGKELIEEVFSHLSNHEQIVFTVFDNTKQNKSSLQEIINSQAGDLSARTSVFTSPSEAIDYIKSVSSEGLSPIFEGIWQNYLGSKDIIAEDQKRKFILISDCNDNINLTASGDIFFCNNTDFNSIFPPETIYILEVSGNYEEGSLEANQQGFLNSAESCGYEILNAGAGSDYKNSINSVLKEFLSEKYLIFWSFIIYIFSVIFIIIINPRRV